MLTGVRGVGKTTTARLIARALNCIGADGKGGPTPNPCGVCAHCTAIAEDRHVDVLEMDAASRLRDAETGTTSVGPHRSDLAVRHLDLDLPAAEGSTGQQKAILVSIALAHARLVALSRGRPPLLLLDEIAAHLDSERREALFDEVVALGAQSWMTGTDAGLFKPLAGRAQLLRVADGSIAAT
jgi:DNA replication and repair protein RecF